MKLRKKFICFAMAMFCFSTMAASSGQEFSPSQLASVLHNNENLDPTLAKHLGIVDNSVRVAADGKHSEITHAPCEETGKVEQKTLLTVQDISYVAVDVESFTCAARYIIVFRGQSQSWHYVDTIWLWNKYADPASYHMQILNDAPTVWVSRQTVDAGMGHSQQNLQLYRLIGSRFRMVFNEPEKLSIVRSPMRKVGEHVWTEEQTSTFKVTPDTGEGEFISEKRSEVANGRRLTVYRSYGWNEQAQMYQAYGDGP